MPGRGWASSLIDLVCNAAAHTDVVVLHDEEELQTVARVIAGVRDKDEALLDRLRFVPARVGTVWLRDFGPVFARDAQGDLLLLDSVYRDARFDARAEAQRVGGTRGAGGAVGSAYQQIAVDLAKRRKDDTAPVYSGAAP